MKKKIISIPILILALILFSSINYVIGLKSELDLTREELEFMNYRYQKLMEINEQNKEEVESLTEQLEEQVSNNDILIESFTRLTHNILTEESRKSDSYFATHDEIITHFAEKINEYGFNQHNQVQFWGIYVRNNQIYYVLRLAWIPEGNDVMTYTTARIWINVDTLEMYNEDLSSFILTKLNDGSNQNEND